VVPFVGAADHGDLAVGPVTVRQPLHDVDAGLLLGAAPVLPAAGRAAGAENVGDRAGVALGDVGPADGVARRLRLGDRVVRRVGEDDRLLFGVVRRVAPDLDPDHRVTDGRDVVNLVDLVGGGCHGDGR